MLHLEVCPYSHFQWCSGKDITEGPWVSIVTMGEFLVSLKKNYFKSNKRIYAQAIFSILPSMIVSKVNQITLNCTAF